MDRVRQALRRHWSLVLLIAIATPYLITVTVTHTRAFSPVDEWVYVDYLHKLPSQGMVYEGDRVGDETLEMLSCDGVSPFGPIGPACDSARPVEEYPNQGYNSAAPYTPVYFAVTRWAGDLVALLPGVDQLTGWRLSGLLWLLGGLVVFSALLRERRVPHVAVLAVGLAFVASPFVWWTYSYVSTDAPGFLLGALLLLLAGRARTSRAAPWCLFAVSVLAVIIKLTNVLGVVLAGLVVVIEAVIAARRGASLPTERPVRESLRPLWFVAAGLAVGLASQLLWLRYLALTAVSAGRADQGVTTPLTTEELLLQVVHFLPAAITASPITAYVPAFPYAPLGWLTVAGVLAAAALVRARRPRDVDALIIATLLAALLAAPALAVTLHLITGSYFQLPPRYAATMLPAFLLTSALVLRRPSAVVAVAAYGAVLLVLGVWLSNYLATLA